jgi:hypothetical protein
MRHGPCPLVMVAHSPSRTGVIALMSRYPRLDPAPIFKTFMLATSAGMTQSE